MRRRLFAFVSAVSLLLCVAATALWVRSYWRLEFLATPQHDFSPGVLRTRPGAFSYRGHLLLALVRQRATSGEAYSSAPLPEAAAFGDSLFSAMYQQSHHAFGFGIYGERTLDDEYYAFALTPIWALVVATAVAPIGWLLKTRRDRRRRRAGLCPR